MSLTPFTEVTDEQSEEVTNKFMASNYYYVYILECSDGSYYTGITNNIENRLKRHNSGKGSRYTRCRLPVIVLYKEKHNSYKLAFHREKEIKGWRREKKNSYLISCFFDKIIKNGKYYYLCYN